METERSDEFEEAGAVASDADQASTQDATDEGGASSAPAEEDTRTAGEAMRDEFLKEYGEETDDAPKEPEASDDPEAEPEEESDPERDQSAETDKVRLTDEEFKALPTKAQQRIGYLSAEARRAKKEAESLTSQVEEFRQSHESITALREFSSKNGLRSEDVTNGLHIMASLQKGDFDGFLRDVMPFVDMARQATGQMVSPDIQKLVDDGEITAEAATRMTRSEIQSKLAQQELTREREARQASDTQRQQGQTLQAMQRAVAETEAALKASDADFALKAPAITAQFEMMLRRGAIPRTPEDAAAMVREIHGSIPVSRPQPRPTPPRPNASTGNRRSAPPTSPRDAVIQALTDGSV